MRTDISRIMGIAALACSAAFAAPAAAAETKAQCRVMTIHASGKEGTTDEKLKDLQILKKAPFDTYKAFYLLGDKTYTLTIGASSSLDLPAQTELAGKLAFKGINEAIKELSFNLAILKAKAKEPEQIAFAVKGKAPFLYVTAFKGDGVLLLHIQCSLAGE